MPRKSKNGIQPIGVGLTAKQMKRRKPINADMLRDIEPLTENQKKLFEAYDAGKNLIAYGVAGTGKTFISLYKALCDVFNPETPYEKIYMTGSCRSWIHYIDLRSAHGTQKEHMDIAEACRKVFTEQFPTVSEALEWE